MSWAVRLASINVSRVSPLSTSCLTVTSGLAFPAASECLGQQTLSAPYRPARSPAATRAPPRSQRRAAPPRLRRIRPPSRRQGSRRQPGCSPNAITTDCQQLLHWLVADTVEEEHTRDGSVSLSFRSGPGDEGEHGFPAIDGTTGRITGQSHMATGGHSPHPSAVSAGDGDGGMASPAVLRFSVIGERRSHVDRNPHSDHCCGSGRLAGVRTRGMAGRAQTPSEETVRPGVRAARGGETEPAGRGTRTAGAGTAP